MENKQCSKCGEEFLCGALAKHCWCKNYTLSKNTLKKLQLEYKDCLCPECLKKMDSANLN